MSDQVVSTPVVVASTTEQNQPIRLNFAQTMYADPNTGMAVCGDLPDNSQCRKEPEPEPETRGNATEGFGAKISNWVKSLFGGRDNKEELK